MGKNLRKLILAVSTIFIVNFSSCYIAKASNIEVAYSQNNIVKTLDEMKIILSEGISNGETKIDIEASSEVLKNLEDIDFKYFIKEVLYMSDDYYHNLVERYRYSSEWSGESGTIKFTIDYIETPEQTRSVEQEVKRILENIISDNMTEDEKVKTIHDYIVNNVQYDSNGLRNGNEAHSAYAALFEDNDGEKNQTVCQGYATLFYKMAKEAGFEAKIITGQSKGQNHAWNLISINNNWYHIDLTWDDPIVLNGPDYVRYDYYNLTDEQIRKDHEVFNDPEKFPKCTTNYAAKVKDAEMLKSIDRHYELPEFTARNDEDIKKIIEKSIQRRDPSCKFRLIAPGADKSKLIEEKKYIIHEILNKYRSDIDASYNYYYPKEYSFSSDEDFIFEYNFKYLKNASLIEEDKNITYLMSNIKEFTGWNSELRPLIVKPAHNFTIKFNKKIDLESLKDNIFIIDKDENKSVKFKSELGQDGTSVILKQEANYNDNKEYMLFIKDVIENYDNSETLNKGIVMHFSTKN